MANARSVNAEIDVTVIEESGDADAIREQWDELAIAAGRPFCSPALDAAVVDVGSNRRRAAANHCAP